MNARTPAKTWFPWLAAVVIAGALVGVEAGPLEPPGPPGEPTMHPIDEVDPRQPIYAEMLPFTIHTPGSYYLAQNVSTTGGGIIVAADNVTIDLMGFTLEGGTGIGIDGTASSWVVVRNGRVRGWSDTGLRLGFNATVEDLTVSDNSGSGIDLNQDSRVLRCLVVNNLVHGIIVGTASLVEDCSASNNSQNGIWVPIGGALVTGCVVDNNSRNGIRADGRATILDNHVRGNDYDGTYDKAGIWLYGDNNRVEGNHVVGNNIGIDVTGNYNIVARNTLRGNHTQSWRLNPSSVGNLILIWTVATIDPPGPWHNVDLQ